MVLSGEFLILILNGSISYSCYIYGNKIINNIVIINNSNKKSQNVTYLHTIMSRLSQFEKAGIDEKKICKSVSV